MKRFIEALFTLALCQNMLADSHACENLLIQVSNLTPKLCQLVGHQTNGTFAGYSYIPGTLMPGQSAHFTITPGYYNFYSKKSSIQFTYDCEGKLFVLESSLSRCGREPEANVLDSNDFFNIYSVTQRSQESDTPNTGYGIVHWFVASPNNIHTEDTTNSVINTNNAPDHYDN